MSEVEEKNELTIEKHQRNELKGIGGWLLLFIIGLIFQCLNWAVQTADVVSSSQQEFDAKVGTVFLGGAASALFGIAAGLLIARKRAGISWSIAAILYLVAVNLFVAFVTPITATDPSSATNAIRSVLYAVIWIPYLRKSVRVRNTYYQVEAALVPAPAEMVQEYKPFQDIK